MKIYFNSNIAEIRKRHRITQDVFAKRLGVKRSVLSAWEEYRSMPRIGTLVKICKALNVTVDDMLTKDFSDGVRTLIRRIR